MTMVVLLYSVSFVVLYYTLKANILYIYFVGSVLILFSRMVSVWAYSKMVPLRHSYSYGRWTHWPFTLITYACRFTMVWAMGCLCACHLYRLITDYGGWHLDFTGWDGICRLLGCYMFKKWMLFVLQLQSPDGNSAEAHHGGVCTSWR